MVRLFTLYICLSLFAYFATVMMGGGESVFAFTRRLKRFGRIFRRERLFPRKVFMPMEDRFTRNRDSRVLFFFPDKNNSSENTTRTVIPMVSRERLIAMADSDEYSYADQWEVGDCEAQYAWQKETRPSCNSMHEIDMAVFPDSKRGSIKLVDNGYWRDVWWIPQTHYDDPLALKTIRYEHNVEDRNFDRNRREALIMDRLIASPWILNIYGFCGNSGLQEFAGDGSIYSQVWPRDDDQVEYNIRETPLNFLQLAYQATLGISAIHNSDTEGRPAIAHTDITPKQFVMVNGIPKLNDFNRARLLTWNPQSKQICKFIVGSNPGKNRAPEEYAHQPETEKIDVYSLGNIFYMLLTRRWPFSGTEEKVVYEKIKSGIRPPIPEIIQNSTNPIQLTLMQAMQMCHIHNPENRSTALELIQFFKEKIPQIAPGKLEKWSNPTTV